MPKEALHGIFVANRKNHHAASFTYKFTGKTMEGEDVVAEFSVDIEPPEGEVAWADDGINPNALAVEEMHVSYGSDPAEIEGLPKTVTLMFSLKDESGSPYTGLAGLIDIYVQNRIVTPGGIDVTWDGALGPISGGMIEAPVGTYRTFDPFTFTDEGEYDVTIWVDFDLDGDVDHGETFTVTIEAEE